MKTSTHQNNYLWMPMILLTASIANFVSAAPQSSPANLTRRGDLPPVPPQYDPDKDTFERYVSKRCSIDQIASEAYGWAEAGVLATALSGWKPTSDYQNAFDLYLGTESSSTKGWFWTYRQRVQNAVNNQKGIHDGTRKNTQGWTHYDAHVFCDEKDSPWGELCGNVEEGVQAYTWWWQSNGFSGNVYLYVVLCPDAYFKQPNLADQLRDIKKDRSKAAWLDNLVDSKGHTWFHETFHWPWLITDPQALDSDPDNEKDKVYGPKDVKAKALEKNTYANSVIADAYAVTGLATTMMQIFGLRDPPQPKPGFSAKNKRPFASMGKAPDNWTPPKGMAANNVSKPDSAFWQTAAKAKINMNDYSIMKAPAPSSPKCGDHGYTMPYNDVMSAHDQLNGKRGKDCCTSSKGACINIANSGNMAIDLCSDVNKGLCVDCGTVADYVGGLVKNCQKDGKVGGTQDIVESPGLTVQI